MASIVLVLQRNKVAGGTATTIISQWMAHWMKFPHTAKKSILKQ